MVASVGRITVGTGYDYLTREVATSRHDYYTGRGEAAGVWAGGGLGELGLLGEVDAGDMAALYGRFVDPRTAGGVRQASGRMLPEVVLGRRVSARRRADGTVVEPVAAFDVTFSPAKSVSVLWATASDERVRQVVADAHEAAVAEALAYLEANAGHTRGGVRGVRRVATSGLIVAKFRHRTARSTRPGEKIGDPQLHSHCAVLNRVRGVDGRWRTLDGDAIYRHAHAAGALYAAVLEHELSVRLGVRWLTPARRVPMREIEGIPTAVLRRFSSRRAQVLEAFEVLLVDWQRKNGRSPTRDERAGMLDQATVRSRRAKQKSDVDLHETWRSQLSVEEQVTIDAVVARTGDRAGDGGRLRTGSLELHEAVFASLQEQRAWWARPHVYAEVARLIAEPTAEAIEIEVERIIGHSVELEPDRDYQYAQLDKTKFTSDVIMAAESRVLVSANRRARWRVPTSATDGLSDDQIEAVIAITAGSYQVATVIGPAGAGKTTMLRAAAECYQRVERPVVVVTLSAAAARVVTEETGLAAWTIAAWKVGTVELPRHGLVIIDEASMVPTLTLDELARVAEAYGTRVALIGDYAQMGAPEAGGLLRDLAALPSATHMTTVRRFRAEWERDASKALRGRIPSVAGIYAEHDRLIAVKSDTATEVAAHAWLVDVLAGHDSLIVVDTAQEAQTVSLRAQELLAAHELIGPRVATATDDTPVCIGDLIQTRQNTTELVTSDGRRVLNRDVWRVTGTLSDGTLLATHTRRGTSVEIPRGYAAEFVGLAYATTIAGAQGRTVDTGHAIVTPHTQAASLYVAMTRGRDANHAYVVTDSHDHEEFRLGNRDPEGAFAAALLRTPDGQLSATSIAQRWHAGARHRNDDRATDRVRQAAVDWWATRQAALPPRVATALRSHHGRVLDQLTHRPRDSWEHTISTATVHTDWDQHDAAQRFLERLERSPLYSRVRDAAAIEHRRDTTRAR